MSGPGGHDPRFEAYDAAPLRGPALEFHVRPALVGDAEAIATISARRAATDPAAIVAAVRGDLESITGNGDRFLYRVAECCGNVVGYGRASLLTPTGREGARNVPDGWYLTGVVVESAFRRRGIGAALTTARIDALAERGVKRVFYFVNDANRASLALHRDLGFEELTRDFVFPGMQFSGGTGILCELVIEAP